jgi:hypothetical protein
MRSSYFSGICRRILADSSDHQEAKADMEWLPFSANCGRLVLDNEWLLFGVRQPLGNLR